MYGLSTNPDGTHNDISATPDYQRAAGVMLGDSKETAILKTTLHAELETIRHGGKVGTFPSISSKVWMVFFALTVAGLLLWAGNQITDSLVKNTTVYSYQYAPVKLTWRLVEDVQKLYVPGTVVPHNNLHVVFPETMVGLRSKALHPDTYGDALCAHQRGPTPPGVPYDARPAPSHLDNRGFCVTSDDWSQRYERAVAHSEHVQWGVWAVEALIILGALFMAVRWVRSSNVEASAV